MTGLVNNQASFVHGQLGLYGVFLSFAAVMRLSFTLAMGSWNLLLCCIQKSLKPGNIPSTSSTFCSRLTLSYCFFGKGKLSLTMGSSFLMVLSTLVWLRSKGYPSSVDDGYMW